VRRATESLDLAFGGDQLKRHLAAIPPGQPDDVVLAWRMPDLNQFLLACKVRRITVHAIHEQLCIGLDAGLAQTARVAEAFGRTEREAAKSPAAKVEEAGMAYREEPADA
jgi:hypothetical protein